MFIIHSLTGYIECWPYSHIKNYFLDDDEKRSHNCSFTTKDQWHKTYGRMQYFAIFIFDWTRLSYSTSLIWTSRMIENKEGKIPNPNSVTHLTHSKEEMSLAGSKLHEANLIRWLKIIKHMFLVRRMARQNLLQNAVSTIKVAKVLSAWLSLKT